MYDSGGSILNNPTGPHPNNYGQHQQMIVINNPQYHQTVKIFYYPLIIDLK